MSKKIITMLHEQRKCYEKKQNFHSRNFKIYSLILLLDIIIIAYTKIQLNGYSWAGIIFLLTLLSVEGIQYKDFKGLKESVDDFYLKGEFKEKNKRR